MKLRQAAAPGPIMTIKEVASYLRVHNSTLYRMVNRGEIPVFKIGSSHRFRRDEIEKWVAEESRPRKRSKISHLVG